MAQSKIYKILDKLVPKKIYFTEHKKLLWENSSPKSTFLKQNINLDLAEYDEVEIVCVTNSDVNTQGRIRVRCRKGEETTAVCPSERTTNSNAYLGYRTFSMDNTKIAVASGRYFLQVNNYTWVDSYCNPYQIYGIRKIGTL